MSQYSVVYLRSNSGFECFNINKEDTITKAQKYNQVPVEGESRQRIQNKWKMVLKSFLITLWNTYGTTTHTNASKLKF